MLSFYGLLEAALLVLNGIAILHRERFLKKVRLAIYFSHKKSIKIHFSRGFQQFSDGYVSRALAPVKPRQLPEFLNIRIRVQVIPTAEYLRVQKAINNW